MIITSLSRSKKYLIPTLFILAVLAVGHPAFAESQSATASIGTGANGTVNITVNQAGAAGNDYTVQVVFTTDPNVDLSVAEVGTDITITLGTDSNSHLDDTKNTATLVAAEINNTLSDVTAVATGNGSAPVLSNVFSGLAGYWTFDDADISGATVNDLSGNSNNGTLTNSPTTGVAGQIGQAIDFDGTDDYIAVDDSVSLDALTTNFTVSAWVNMDAGTTWDVIYRSGTQTNYWDLQFAGDPRLDFIEAGIAQNVSSTGLSSDTWYHIAVVKNGDTGTNLAFYTNGATNGTASVGTVTTPSGQKQIGRDTNFAETEFDGTMDDLRIYNRALSADEITYLNNYVNDGVHNFSGGADPEVVLSDTSLTITEGDQDSYTLVLDTEPTNDVVVTLSASTPGSGSGISLSSSVVTFTPDDWDTPQTVTVTAVEDSNYDTDRSVTISSEVTSNDSFFDGITVDDVVVDILEDETLSITTCAELQALKDDLAGHYSLSNNINCAGFDPDNDGKGFIPIGQNDPFTGSFDTNGHNISNLTINRPDEDYVGLFGYVDGGTLTFQNFTISGSIEGQGYVGALIGYTTNGTTTVDYVSSSVVVTGHNSYIAGLVGYANNEMDVTGSHVTADLVVSSDDYSDYIGGLVAYFAYSATIANSYFEGDITATSDTSSIQYLGGLVGYASDELNLTNTHTIGDINITADSDIYIAGGLVGYVSNNATLDSSYYDGNITGTSSNSYVEYVAGLVGYINNNLTMTGSHANGDILLTANSSIEYVAGIIGYIGSDATVNSIYYEGNITAESTDSDVRYAGELIGYINGNLNMTSSHATGDVLLNADNSYVEYIAGLVGYIGSEATVDSVYHSGNLSAEGLTSDVQYAGELIGYINGNLNMTSSHATGNILLHAGGSDVRYSAGLIGYVGSDSTLDSTYYIGDFTATSDASDVEYVGGLVGYASSAIDVTASYVISDMVFSATDYDASYIGGLSGYVGYSAVINASYTQGNINTTSNIDDAKWIGGLIGYSYLTQIENSFASMNLTGNHELGGLIGIISNSDATITNSYSIGSITGDENVGGLVGQLDHQFGGSTAITNSFSAGLVTADGATNYGGMVGQYTPGDVTFTNSFFDITTSGQTLCASKDSGGTTGCSGVNTSNTIPDYFKRNRINSPLNSWDFQDVWETTYIYPELKVFIVQQPHGHSNHESGSSSGTPTPVPPSNSLSSNSPVSHPQFIINSGTIYFIKDGVKYPFRNLNEFLSYGFSLSLVHPATEADKVLPLGPVVKAKLGTLVLDQGTGYLIGSNNTKQPFTSSQAFVGLGFSFKNLFKIDLSDYTSGNPITTALAPHPEGSLINEDGTIYLILQNQKYGFTSAASFSSYGFNFNQVVKANSFDVSLTVGEVMK